MEPVRIGARLVGPGHPVFIIAEAGVNHNGDLELAKHLIDVAAEAGVDAVKFQSFKADLVISASAPKPKYQLRATDAVESQLEMIRRLELSPEIHRKIQAYCKERDIFFMSTPFDTESADLLDHLGVPAFKIASGEITNLPLLTHVARKSKPMIVSTGMSYLSEVDTAVTMIRDAGNNQLVLLHCINEYPAHPTDANLRAMQTMAFAFDVPVGYSDHTLGIEVALAAVALGACVVEKHFTLDKALPGPDHQASLEPRELQALVKGIRTVEQALGNGEKRPARCEMENRFAIRRSLAAASNIPEGTVIRPHMLQALRPANGISPTLLDSIVGRRARRSLKTGEFIVWSDLE